MSPTKLLRLLTVTVITALVEPGAILTRVVLEKAKSPTWTVDIAEWVALPVDATPVIVNGYVPEEAEFNEQVRVTAELGVRRAWLVGHVIPSPLAVEGLIVTLPEKLNVLVRITFTGTPV